MFNRLNIANVLLTRSAFSLLTEEGIQPRHRFMSSYEQKIETPDKNYQYVLFACDPYETVGFKVK